MTPATIGCRCSRLGLAAAAALALTAGALSVTTQAAQAEPKWRLEQPSPPLQAGESQEESNRRPRLGLGKVGDIEFWAPNRGVLITAGNPPTVAPGVWAFNGESWHQLSTVCGGTDGRIAWAGPDEFWTISDGRPGQANVEGTPPPLKDNTLCHFLNGQVVGSYASLAFRADSYQAMHAAGCLSPSDCWFAGDPLPSPQAGAFHLHWNGDSIAPEPNPQGHAVEDMRQFGGRLFESVRILPQDKLTFEESPTNPSDLHLITPVGVQPTFLSLTPGVPVYATGESPAAMDFLHLSAVGDGGCGVAPAETPCPALWGAANPASEAPRVSVGGEVSITRYSQGLWSQVIGPGSDPAGGNPFTTVAQKPEESEAEREETKKRENANEVVGAIAAEPGSESAWLALSTVEDVRSAENPGRAALLPATVARISTNKVVSERQTLPSQEEVSNGVGPKGAADKLACPAARECWLATTQGWLFHYTTGSRLPFDTDPAFSSLITFRPKDLGVPQVVPDAPPVDNSGLLGEPPPSVASLLETSSSTQSTVALPLLSNFHTRLVKGTTLELRFHLAVKARIRILALRRGRVVASTPMRTLAAGSRKLLLRLDPKRWPTKLSVQSHALAPLPRASTRGAAVTTVGTGLVLLPHTPTFAGTATGSSSLP